MDEKYTTQDIKMDAFYTPKDIEKILQISKNTAYKLINLPDFPKIYIGKNIRIPKRLFEEFISGYDKIIV